MKRTLAVFLCLCATVRMSDAQPDFGDHICFKINPNDEPQDAITACSAYIQNNNDDPRSVANAHASLGIALREVGDLERSAEELRYSLEIVDDDAGTMRMLAWTYRELGQLSDAEQIYTKVLEIDDHWQGWLSRCVVRQDQQRYAVAVPDCMNAIERDPESLDALFFAARAHNFNDNGALALPLAQRALKLAPDDPRHAGELVWAMHLSGDKQAAITKAEEFLHVFPNDPELMFFLSEMR